MQYMPSLPLFSFNIMFSLNMNLIYGIVKIGPYLFPSNTNFEYVQYSAAFESSTSLLVYFLFSVSNVAMARGANRKSITDALRFMGKMASGKWLKQHTMVKYTAIPRYYTAYLCERNIVILQSINKLMSRSDLISMVQKITI